MSFKQLLAANFLDAKSLAKEETLKYAHTRVKLSARDREIAERIDKYKTQLKTFNKAASAQTIAHDLESSPVVGEILKHVFNKHSNDDNKALKEIKTALSDVANGVLHQSYQGKKRDQKVESIVEKLIKKIEDKIDDAKTNSRAQSDALSFNLDQIRATYSEEEALKIAGGEGENENDLVFSVVKKNKEAIESIYCKDCLGKAYKFDSALESLGKSILKGVRLRTEGASEKASTIAKDIVKEYKGASITSLAPFRHPMAGLYRDLYISEGRNPSLSEFQDHFVRHIAQKLCHEKGYESEDAIKKAENLFEGLVKDLDVKAIESYCQAYLKSVDVDEKKLLAYKNAMADTSSHIKEVPSPLHQQGYLKFMLNQLSEVETPKFDYKAKEKNKVPEAVRILTTDLALLARLYEKAILLSKSKSITVNSAMVEILKEGLSSQLDLYKDQYEHYESKIIRNKRHEEDPKVRFAAFLKNVADQVLTKTVQPNFDLLRQQLDARFSCFDGVKGLDPVELDTSSLNAVIADRAKSARKDYERLADKATREFANAAFQKPDKEGILNLYKAFFAQHNVVPDSRSFDVDLSRRLTLALQKSDPSTHSLTAEGRKKAAKLVSAFVKDAQEIVTKDAFSKTRGEVQGREGRDWLARVYAETRAPWNRAQDKPSEILPASFALKISPKTSLQAHRSNTFTQPTEAEVPQFASLMESPTESQELITPPATPATSKQLRTASPEPSVVKEELQLQESKAPAVRNTSAPPPPPPVWLSPRREGLQAPPLSSGSADDSTQESQLPRELKEQKGREDLLASIRAGKKLNKVDREANDRPPPQRPLNPLSEAISNVTRSLGKPNQSDVSDDDWSE